MITQLPAPSQVHPDPSDEPAHAWAMAVFHFREATKHITEMARDPNYRDLAVEDLGEISDAVLAANLMWSQLKQRRAA